MGPLRAGARDPLSPPESDGLPEIQLQPRHGPEIAQRVVGDGAIRGGEGAAGLDADEVTALSGRGSTRRAFHKDPRQLIELMQEDDFSHSDLHRKARRAHERKLRAPSARSSALPSAASVYADAASAPVRLHDPGASRMCRRWPSWRREAQAVLPRGRAEARRPDRRRDRLDARCQPHASSGFASTGFPATRSRSIGTDPRVDRRLPAVAEVEVPLYAGLISGPVSRPGRDACRGPL